MPVKKTKILNKNNNKYIKKNKKNSKKETTILV